MVWLKNLKFESNELESSYLSNFFNESISIYIPSSKDYPSPAQVTFVNQIIEKEILWANKLIPLLINYYNDAYPNYRIGWELGETDEKIIERSLPKEMNRSKMLELTSHGAIYVDAGANDKFGFALSCEWDGEHGIGALIEKWEIVEVGLDAAFV